MFCNEPLPLHFYFFEIRIKNVKGRRAGFMPYGSQFLGWARPGRGRPRPSRAEWKSALFIPLLFL